MRFWLPNREWHFDIPTPWWLASGISSNPPQGRHYIVRPYVGSRSVQRPALVPLDQIAPPKRNVRIDFGGMGRDRMISVLTAIAFNQHLPRIVLRWSESGYRFALYDGFHRYHASIAAGFTDVPALIVGE